MLIDPAIAERFESSGRVFCLTASPATTIARVRADGIVDRPLLDTADPERVSPNSWPSAPRPREVRGGPDRRSNRRRDRRRHRRSHPRLARRVRLLFPASTAARSGSRWRRRLRWSSARQRRR